jgi:hypothetical protein
LISDVQLQDDCSIARVINSREPKSNVPLNQAAAARFRPTLDHHAVQSSAITDSPYGRSAKRTHTRKLCSAVRRYALYRQSVGSDASRLAPCNFYLDGQAPIDLLVIFIQRKLINLLYSDHPSSYGRENRYGNLLSKKKKTNSLTLE